MSTESELVTLVAKLSPEEIASMIIPLVEQRKELRAVLWKIEQIASDRFERNEGYMSGLAEAEHLAHKSRVKL